MKTTGKIGPFWGLVAGILYLAGSCAILIWTAYGLKVGRIARLSRHHSAMVSREHSPSEFWLSAAIWGLIGGILLWKAVPLVRDNYRQLRSRDDE